MRLSFKKTIFFYWPLVILMALASCTSPKKLVYFNTKDAIGGETANKNYNPVLRTDDILTITVLGVDAEAVKPFNIPVQMNMFNQNIGSYSQGAPTPQGYLIDPQGNIDFPVIGKVRMAGLHRTDAVDTLKALLKPYLTSPTVMIRIINYKITVLGEVRNPGTFTIPNERVTLPEALGIAGDLLITGVRKNVLVIRDVDGKKTETRVSLTSKDLFSSPVYYLNQNDIVYVEPNRAKINSSVVNTANVSLVVSIVSLLVTMGVLLTR